VNTFKFAVVVLYITSPAAGEMIASLCAVVILGGKNPFVVLVTSNREDAFGVTVPIPIVFVVVAHLVVTVWSVSSQIGPPSGHTATIPNTQGVDVLSTIFTSLFAHSLSTIAVLFVSAIILYVTPIGIK